MRNKFTPGPWRVCGGYTAHYCSIHSAQGYIVYGMADKDVDQEGLPKKFISAPDYDTQRANAQLIAAAPDLLAALQACVREMERNDFSGSDNEYRIVRSNAHAALAKAQQS